MKKAAIILGLLVCVITFQSCTGNKPNPDITEVDGMKIKTFYNEADNIEMILITEGSTTLAAQPTVTIARARKMSDEEFKCLSACKKTDGSFDMNCVLKCPVTKQFRVVTF